MEEHALFQAAMERGDAKAVARELGYRSGAVPRRWTRPRATPTNLFTGQLSQFSKAKLELLAHDRVNERAADILLFSMIADLAKQRAEIHPDDCGHVVHALAVGYHQAIEAVLMEATQARREEQLYRAGANVVRAILFVIGDDGAGVPLRKVAEPPKSRLKRLGDWFLNLRWEI